MSEVLHHAVLDTLKMLPFLFAAYLLIEYLEHRASAKITGALSKMGPLGPVGGALLGCIPQCGFSVAAANFFSGRVITIGTLIAVFISTSDEAIPIILAHPEQIKVIAPLIAFKIAMAVVAGIFTDFIYNLVRKGKEDEPFHDLCEHCHCDRDGILKSAIHHTVHIFLFILVVNIILGAAINFVGRDTISKIMLGDSVFQPFLTALIGLIPNCAPSVILTELYINGSISFGSVLAGLSTGAGIGLAVLFRTNKHPKQNILIVSIVYFFSVLCGIIINLLV